MGSTGSSTPDGRVTIVVVPRERFSSARESLESVFENTQPPFELVYVDAGSPRSLRRWLRSQAAEHGFRLLERDGYLSPNQARNVGLDAVTTEFAVFIDNDVGVRAGWLERLVDCADSTGATVVGPVICEAQDPYLAAEHPVDTIHFAGGRATISRGSDDSQVIRDEIYRQHEEMEAVRGELAREQMSLTEFHCFLARSERIRALGGFDEGLLSTREHVDLSLSVAEHGGTLWFEPDAVVVWSATAGLRFSDLPYYMLRWSDDWGRASLEHFRRKWNLAYDQYFERRIASLSERRQSRLIIPLVRRITFGHGSPRLEGLLKRIESRVNKHLSDRYSRQQSQATPVSGAA